MCVFYFFRQSRHTHTHTSLHNPSHLPSTTCRCQPSETPASQQSTHKDYTPLSFFLLMLDSNCSVYSVPRVQFFFSLQWYSRRCLASDLSVMSTHTHNTPTTHPHCFNTQIHTVVPLFLLFLLLFLLFHSSFHHLNVFFDFCFIPDYLFIYPFLQFSPDFSCTFCGRVLYSSSSLFTRLILTQKSRDTPL